MPGNIFSGGRGRVGGDGSGVRVGDGGVDRNMAVDTVVTILVVAAGHDGLSVAKCADGGSTVQRRRK